MARIIKRKSKLKAVYDQLDQTARALVRADLQRQRADERFDQQISQLFALHRLGTFINSTFDLEDILNAVSESFVKDLDFEKSGMVFFEKTGQKPMQSSFKGFSSTEFRILLDRFNETFQKILHHEKEVYSQTTDVAPEEWNKLLKALSLCTILFIPVRAKSRLVGAMIVGRTHVNLRLTEAERQFYCMYASQVGAAVENARLYEALGQSNITLEEKVRERTHNLLEANARLRELDTVKSNFISLVSHELRTPLTAIKGFVGTLFHFDKEIPDEKRKVYLSVLNEETDRLTRLITDLLDVSRIESGKTEMKWSLTYLPRLVKRVFEKLSMKAAQVQLHMDFHSDFPDIVVDVDKMEQILMNLVGNSLKYSPPRGKITVTGRRHHDGIVVEVSDEGPGIAFSELEKIFSEFYRLDNDINQKSPGTGLGLTICRALINLHGGKIWAESETGQGARMLFRLPMNKDKLARTASAVEEIRGGHAA